MSEPTADEIKVIQRVKKLHAMAIGAQEVGSLAEADAFMEAVEKTLAKHNLESSVLTLDMRDVTDPLGYSALYGAVRRHRDKPVEWVQTLAYAVGAAHYCEVHHSVGSSYVWFYGRKSNHETALAMFVYLRDMAERLAWKAYRAECRRQNEMCGYTSGMNLWYLDWLEGFALEVARRYRAMRARVESDNGMSVVLVSVRQEAYDFAKDKVASPETLEKLEKPIWEGAGFSAARNAGKDAAATANIRPHVVAEKPASAQKALRSGGDT